MSYRKIWEKIYGTIPKDDKSITYDIHHIDGNRRNNDITNLICLSVDDHYKIHLEQFLLTKSHKDRASLNFLGSRLEKKHDDITGHIVSEETREKIRKSLKGKKRPKNVGESVKKHLTGYKWSEESLEKRRQGILNYYKNLSEEERLIKNKKVSDGSFGKEVSEETRLKLAKYNSKLSDDDVITIYKLIKEKVTYKIISERFNISPVQISYIKQRKTYKWVEITEQELNN